MIPLTIIVPKIEALIDHVLFATFLIGVPEDIIDGRLKFFLFLPILNP